LNPQETVVATPICFLTNSTELELTNTQANYWWGQMHCGQSNRKFEWEMAHPAHAAAPHVTKQDWPQTSDLLSPAVFGSNLNVLFYCGTLPDLYTVGQRRILFYKNLKQHSSILVRTLAKLCQHDILSVAAKYGINRLNNSVSSIKKSMWHTFAASAV